MPPPGEILAVSTTEEKQAKEYGKIVLFVIKHWKVFAFILGALYTAWQTIQTIKVELAMVKKEVSGLSEKVDKFDKKLDKVLDRRSR